MCHVPTLSEANAVETLRSFAVATSNDRPTKDAFDQWASIRSLSIRSQDITRACGAWQVAVQRAGLREPRGARSRWTRELAIAKVQAVVAKEKLVGQRVSVELYRSLLQKYSGTDLPGLRAIYRLFGSWSVLMALVGCYPGLVPSRDPQEGLDLVRRAYEELGHPPSLNDIYSVRRPGEPNPRWLMDRLDSSWKDILVAAGLPPTTDRLPTRRRPVTPVA